MFSIACTSSSTCIEVGAGGRERRTTDGGNTWSDVATAPGNNKPLTQIACPTSSICYAVGDRGNAMKSTDGGQTWSWLSSTDGNPIYGLSCPSTTVCYATDIYAHVIKTTDGGATWTWQTTPITTPYAPVVAETGGPNPWGGLMGISCSDANTCVGVGHLRDRLRPDEPEPGSADRHDDRRRHDLDAAGERCRHGELPARRLVPARARRPARRSAAAARSSPRPNLTTWTAATSNTTNMLNSVTLPEHVVLHRGRPERHGRRLQRHDVDGDHRQRRHRHARRRRLPATRASATRPASRASRIADDDGGAPGRSRPAAARRSR